MKNLCIDRQKLFGVLMLLCLYFIKPQLLIGEDMKKIREIETKAGVNYSAVAAAMAEAFKSSQCVPKAGTALVSGDVYIALNREMNTLWLGEHHLEWVGAEKKTKQAVLVFHEKVMDQNNLPKDFELSGSILISFEENKVSFFDFSSFQGGYYLR